MARVEGSVCAWLFPPTTVETHMCLTKLEIPNQHAQFFLPRILRQSLSCVLIPFPCVLPGSRVEFCQWCALVRCSPFCLTFLFVPFSPRHHRTSHHGISTHLRHFGVTGFLLSPSYVRSGNRLHSLQRSVNSTRFGASSMASFLFSETRQVQKVARDAECVRSRSSGEARSLSRSPIVEELRRSLTISGLRAVRVTATPCFHWVAGASWRAHESDRLVCMDTKKLGECIFPH